MCDDKGARKRLDFVSFSIQRTRCRAVRWFCTCSTTIRLWPSEKWKQNKFTFRAKKNGDASVGFFTKKDVSCVAQSTWPIDKTRIQLKVKKSGSMLLFSQIVDSFRIMNKIIIWSANAAIHVRVCFRFEYSPELRSDCCCNLLVGNENCNTFSIPIRDPTKFKKKKIYHVKSKNKFWHEIYWFFFLSSRILIVVCRSVPYLLAMCDVYPFYTDSLVLGGNTRVSDRRKCRRRRRRWRRGKKDWSAYATISS